MPCVYLPGPAPAVTVANIFYPLISGGRDRKEGWKRRAGG